MQEYLITDSPRRDLSNLNRAILHPDDSFAQFEHIAIRIPKSDAAFVFSIALDKAVDRGYIAFNNPSRKWASLMKGKKIEAAPYKFEHSQCLNRITFSTDSKVSTPIDFDSDEMSKQFSQKFYNQAFTVGQLIGFFYEQQGKNYVFDLKVEELEAVNIKSSDGDVATSSVEIGLTTANTIIIFERAENSQIRLTGSLTGKVAAPQIFSQNWDFSSMGIGGLSEQFNKLFRRAFATRLLPPQFAESFGAEHVRGILLFGPPGTGKTLIARQIGKMLLAREPKIVNGPEVLNKYVGESEANIRNLFKDAEEEQAKAGIHSGLHMIIFDEIDAICKSRGNSASTSGVGDNVVNQLLSKIDGVNSLHNVLLVGMTNRRDLIDEALLRPGRLEIQIEIGLPNKEGRLEIFKIHTKKMRDQNILDPSVSLEDLAEVSRNYTGAEIAGLIKAATSLAVNRVVKPESISGIDKELLDSIKVTRADFDYAMKHDVKPALGASEDQLKQLSKPIIQWDPAIQGIQSRLNDIIEKISAPDLQNNQPYFVLLIGKPGAGLTTLAANMATNTSFPFIRVYQSIATAGKSESGKVQYMEKLFNDAARSEMSCVVIDGLERILDYVHIGPRFSNTSRNLFIDNKDLALPEGHRMLVVCTCNSDQFLEDLLLTEVFDCILDVPYLTKPQQVKKCLSNFTPDQCNRLIDCLSSTPFEIGIKKIVRLNTEAARDDPTQQARLFLERMDQTSRRLLRKGSVMANIMA